MRRKITAIALAVLAVGLCGCSPVDELSRDTGAAPRRAADSSPLSRWSPEERIEDEGSEPSPTHDSGSDSEALNVASAALTAYLRRDLPARAWLEGLEPHLTTGAIVALSSIDPVAIPAATVSGPIVLHRDSSGYLARATVPTESGAYLLLLAREASGPWLVSTITRSAGEPL